MTSNAKSEKDLKRMQQRLDILAPIIKDAHDSCFSLCKFLMTALITLHGGAIGIIIANFYITSYSSIGYFLCGIILSCIMGVVFVCIDHFQICEYYKYVFRKNADYKHIFRSIKQSKCRTYAYIYIISLASILLFIYGIEVSFKNSISITRI